MPCPRRKPNRAEPCGTYTHVHSRASIEAGLGLAPGFVDQKAMCSDPAPWYVSRRKTTRSDLGVS